MKILLTGATGFLGSHLARSLVRLRHDVFGIKRTSSSFLRICDIEGDMHWFAADSAGDVDPAAFNGVDIVIHTAAIYGRKGETVAELVNTNILKSLRLVEAAVRHGVRKFINADSALPREISPYSLSKGQFAQWARVLAESRDIDFVNLRLEHIYGPGDEEIKFVCHVINACLKNQVELRLTTGTQKRDFIYVEDVVDAFVVLIGNVQKLEHGFIDIPLGSGAATSVRDLVETIHQLTNSSTRLLFGALPDKSSDGAYSCADISILKGLGWAPATDLCEGIRLTIQSERQS